MLRCDGRYKIYTIQMNALGKWMHINYMHFGYPAGFNASGECWQETGIHGVFDLALAKRGLDQIKKKNPNNMFRLVLVTIEQSTSVVQI